MLFIFLADTGNANPFKPVYQRNQLSSVSTALLLAMGIAIFEALDPECFFV